MMQNQLNEQIWEQQICEGWGDEQKQGVNLKKIKSKSKTQSMLSNLSKNLLTYQNSYKKQKKLYSLKPQRCQNLHKRKMLKKKLNFDNNSENDDKHEFMTNKQNRNHVQNQLYTIKQKKNSIKQKQTDANCSKLEKMFRVLKQFDSLNATILPFKVNMNKISHKRIIASMIFKQVNTQKNSSIQQNGGKLPSHTENFEQSKKQHIETEYVPVKHRMYSLDISKKVELSKRKYQEKSLKHIKQDQNDVFALNFNKCSDMSFTRRKRSFSVRKADYPTEKTIQQIRHNRTKIQTISQRQNCINQPTGKQNIAKEKPRKENEYFSDSRFFIKRQALRQIKGQLNNLRR